MARTQMKQDMDMLLGHIHRYTANSDPKTAAGNQLALLIGSNQPFYPIYVYTLVGAHTAASLLTLISTPLFLAAPILARRDRLAGRVLLCLAGLFNTSLSAWMLGPASGIDVFYLPCLMLVVMVFGPGERWISAGLAALTGGLYLLFGPWCPFPALFTPGQAHALYRLNLVSGWALVLFLAVMFARLARSSKETAH